MLDIFSGFFENLVIVICLCLLFYSFLDFQSLHQYFFFVLTCRELIFFSRKLHWVKEKSLDKKEYYGQNGCETTKENRVGRKGRKTRVRCVFVKSIV